VKSVITEIRRQRNALKRYSVFIDSEYAFSLDEMTLVRLRLTEGQAIDAEGIQEIVVADNESKAFDAALRYLKVRDRSTSEIRKRLGEKGYDEQAVTYTVNRLAELGYVDDTRFAQSWIRRAMGQQPMGRRKLESDLLQKGIDRSIVEEMVSSSLDDAAERELAMVLARQKTRNRGSGFADNPAERRRLELLLRRRGFDWEIVHSVIREVCEGTE